MTIDLLHALIVWCIVCFIYGFVKAWIEDRE